MDSLIDYYLKRNCELYPNKVSAIYRENNEYKILTYLELFRFVISLAYYLKPNFFNKKIAIIGNNKIEWFISFLAILGYVGESILVDKEIKKNELDDLFTKLKPDLVIYDDELNLDLEKYEVLKFSEISDIMKKKMCILLEGRKNGSVFLHTSGTTGACKIVKLTEDNLFSSKKELTEKWNVTSNDSCLLIIPLYHIYALTTAIHAIYIGASVVLEYDYNRLSEALAFSKPTIFIGVPLIYNRIKEEILENGKLKIYLLILISKLCLMFNLDFRKKIFKNIHKYFGERYFFGCSAGNKLKYTTNKFFYDLGLPIYNVYGMTETAGPIAMCYESNNKFNSVGKILKINDVKIENVKNGIGEIWVRGSNLFDGYYNEKNIKNKYFDTGDIGYIKNDFLYVTGRKKKILIGDNGKNISEEEINQKILKYKDINSCNVIMNKNHLIIIIDTELDKSKINNIISNVNNELPRYKRIYDYKIVNKK